MLVKYYLLAVINFTICLNALAQTPNVSYYKNEYTKVDNRDSASFTRIISAPDSNRTLYNVKEYYKNGQLKLTGKSLYPDICVLHTDCIRYYASGSKQQVAFYDRGKLDGEVFNYFPNGQLYNVQWYAITNKDGSITNSFTITACYDSTGKALAVKGNGHYVGYSDDFKTVFEEGEIANGLRTGEWKGTFGKNFTFTETYFNGKFVSGKSTDDDGKIYHYTQRGVEPMFPGGVKLFYKFLSSEVTYPPIAKKNKIGGKVVITFVVEPDGALSAITITSSPSPVLAEESLRVVKLSPTWIPGQQFGRPVRVQYSIPITFTPPD